MKKLSKEQLETKRDLIARLKENHEGLDDKLSAILSEIDEFNNSIDEFNYLVDEVESFIDEITSDQTNYFSDRSEKWQESEAGERYAEWMLEWEEAYTSLERIERIDYPIDSLDDYSYQDTLDELTDSWDEI